MLLLLNLSVPQIHTIEQDLMAAPFYTSRCQLGSDGRCMLPDSVLNILFPEQVRLAHSPVLDECERAVRVRSWHTQALHLLMC